MIGIIGGSGFVGTNLRRELDANGVAFKNYDIDPAGGIDTEFCDVRDLHPEQFTSCRVLINLAAVHRDDVRPLSLYEEVNVGGASEVCRVAEVNQITRIVFVSSVAVYGFAPPETGEDGEIDYFNEYGHTKYKAEQIYREWYSRDPENRSLVIVRPTVIFGPGNRGNVYNLLRQIASGRFAMFGDGRNVKSMAYVENVAKFLMHCIGENPGIHVYNYVDKPDLSMNQLVQVVRKTLFDKSGVGLRMPGFLGVTIGVGFDLLALIIRRPLPVSSIRVKKFMATTQFSSSVLETGFEAPYTLAQGLEKTLRYEFIQDNRDKPTYETE